MFRTAPSLLRAAAPRRAFSSSASRDVARISIVGRLGASPELITSQAGREYVRYTLASYSNATRETSWFRITSFMGAGKSRDYLMAIPKGSLLLVDGEATLNVKEDAEGRKFSTLNVVSKQFDVITRSKTDEAAESSEDAEHIESQ
ncbi:ssDNA-binding protein, mitochondrial [Ophidiomyces ophidiicola]|nr:ssDNA-binding protein, mitochondrial [Ophidiomyces ophidiicola]